MGKAVKHSRESRITIDKKVLDLDIVHSFVVHERFIDAVVVLIVAVFSAMIGGLFVSLSMLRNLALLPDGHAVPGIVEPSQVPFSWYLYQMPPLIGLVALFSVAIFGILWVKSSAS